MLSQFFAPVTGGVERVVQDLSVELLRRGHEVAVATLRVDGAAPAEDVDGVRIHRVDSLFGRFGRLYADKERRHLPPGPDPKVVSGLRRVLAKEKPDIVHAHNWIVHSYLPRARSNRPPLVLSLHDYGLLCANTRLMRFGSPCTGPSAAKCFRCSANYYGIAKGSAVTGALLVREPSLRRLVDMYLPVSGPVAATLRLAERDLPFQVLPNLIPERTHDDRRVDSELIAGLPGDRFLLFLGDAAEDKGAHVLLDAYASLDEAPPLVFVGRPFGLRDRQLPRGVHVFGPWPHACVLEAVKRCGIVVTPSLFPEPFGMVALEAMSCGRPVVASDIGGLSELVVDGGTGILVPPGDATALAAAIASLISDPARVHAFGRAGKARAELYSPSRIVPRLEEVYGSLLAARASGGEN